MTVVVVGASGLLGTELVATFRERAIDVRTMGRSLGSDLVVDFSDAMSLPAALRNIRASVIINLAALTDVEYCELNPNSAFFTNVGIVNAIVEYLSEYSRETRFIQISTDHVYDGSGESREGDECLTNYYAFSKYAGELAALRLPTSTILRTNFFGKSQLEKRKSFTDWIFESLNSGQEISLFNDVFFSPISMVSLCDILVSLTDASPAGIFNVGSREGMSKADFGINFANMIGMPTSSISVCSVADATYLKTYRPRDMRMQVANFEAYLGRSLPTLADELSELRVFYE